MCKYLMGGIKKMEPGSFQWHALKVQRQWAQTAIKEMCEKKHFYSEGG